jgi:hypothetical protein
MYTGTNSDALYYNPALDQTVTGLTPGNTLIAIAMGGGLDIKLTNGFSQFLQIDGSDFQCGMMYVADTPVPFNAQAAKTSISSSSVTVKLGGFSRFDSRAPVLDLRNSTSNEGAGNGALGGQLRWTFIEVKA